MSTARSIVGIADPKTKHLLFAVAAENMQHALYPFLRYEMHRGFLAWGFVVRQQRRVEKAGAYLRFLTMRNIIVGLNSLLRGVLVANIRIWRNFAVMESLRIKKEQIRRAAVKIQSIARQRISLKRIEGLRQRRKYQRLYDATIKIQALIRGKLVRWRYLKTARDRIRRQAAMNLQRAYRGYYTRKRVAKLMLRRSKYLAATLIQKIMRAKLATKRVAVLLAARKKHRSATLLQTCVRGYLGRKHMARTLIERARYRYAVRIQAMVRGKLVRIHILQKIKEMEDYRYYRNKAATKIQATYRGYHSRLLHQMMLYKLKKEKKEQYRAATIIGKTIRGFISRAYLREMHQQRYEQWIIDARHWRETWSEESQNWYYYNESTGDAVWEPAATGYTKVDGISLVLASGEIIEDPAIVRARAKALAAADGDDSEDDEEAAEARAEAERQLAFADKKKLAKLCSECQDRMAIRACTECGDKFCTKCYKYLHATGSRRYHTYTAVGPIDCTECELVLAERWCVSCDEAYCDGCWRKVHSHGKRVFHPYSEVSAEGRVDARILTMDGEQVRIYMA